MARPSGKSLSEVISDSINNKSFDLNAFKKSKFLDKSAKFKKQINKKQKQNNNQNLNEIFEF